MPVNFTLPPDTRAIGTGNPPQDMNGVADALTAMGAGCNALNAAFSGGADPTGTASSDAAFAAAAAAAAAAGVPFVIPAGTYKVTAPLDWRVPLLNVTGAGMQNTKIVQATANTQIARLAGQHQQIRGLSFQYGSQQASGNTNAIAVSFGDDTVGSCFESIFEDLYIVNAQTGMAVDPSVGTVGGLFSCTIRNIQITGNGGQSAISIIASNGTGANITGNNWEAIYCSNNFNGTASTWAGRPVNLQGCDNDSWTVLNIEHGNAFNGDVLGFTQCFATVVDDLHIESVPVSGTSPGFGQVLVNNSTVGIRGMTVRNPTLTGTPANPVARFAGSGNRLTIDGYYEPAGGSYGTHPWADWNSVTNSAMTVRNVTLAQVTGNQINSGAGDLLRFGNQDGSLSFAPAGAVGETFPRRFATLAQSALNSGTLYVTSIDLEAGAVVSNITMVTNTTVKTGGTHGWYVLLDTTMKVLAVTADKTDATTTWGTISTAYPIAVTAPYTAAYSGQYYIGVMVAETAGTMPTFSGSGGPGPPAGSTTSPRS